jgi:type VI secretion system secreted protein Hcp
MAQDIFLKIDNVKGESTEQAHKDEIEVINWAWTQIIPIGSAGSGGGSAGRPSPPSISFTHYIDRASPALMKLGLTGQTIRSAILFIRKAGARPPSSSDYFKLEMSEVKISGFSPTGEAGDTRSMETVTLTCSKIKEEYNYSPATGGSTTYSEEFDFRHNA